MNASHFSPLSNRFRSLRQALCTLALALASAVPAPAQVAEIDPTFDPVIGGNAQNLVVLPDGKLLLSGGLSSVNGVARTLIARLLPDGSLDSSFNLFLGGGNINTTNSLAVEPDGTTYIGGWSTLAGTPATTQNLIVRLLPDGTVDPTFHSAVDLTQDRGFGPTVTAIVPQPDGKLLVSGIFVSIGGVPSSFLGRLNADGSRDTTFTASVLINRQPTVLLQPDGRIILCGNATNVNGVARNITRLLPDGSVDATYDPVINGRVSFAHQLPEGQLVVMGAFTSVGGVARAGIARLNADGTLDGTAYATASIEQPVSASQVQEDGAYFAKDNSGDTLRRYRPDGTVDPTFSVSRSPLGNSLFLSSFVYQPDGRILVPLSSRLNLLAQQSARTASRQIVRLSNDAPESIVAVPDATRVRWIRRGALQVTPQTVFQYSADGLTGWTQLGAGTWKGNGVWELTGLNLPASGFVRALALQQAWVSGGNLARGWSGPTVAYRLGNPLLAAETAAGAALANGATQDFGTAEVGRTREIELTLRNRGNAPLTGLTATLSGTGASHFQLVTAPGSSVPGPGGTTAVRVRFAPISVGAKTAQLTLASNDPQQPNYLLTLTAIAEATGGIDSTFAPGVVRFQTSPPEAPGTVEAVITGLGDRLLLGGIFDALGALERDNVGRLLGSGAVDPTFYTRANGEVFALAALEDGGVLVGGAFTQLNGSARNGFGRYGNEGALATSFDLGLGAISQIAPLADGRVFVANQGGTVLQRRLADGSLDAAFAPVLPLGQNVVIVPLPDGRVVVAHGTLVNNRWVTQIQRLTTAGAVDAGFAASPLDASVTAMVLQRDGRLVVGGLSYPGPTGLQPFVARLNADGSTDATLALTGIGTTVYALGLQADGKILVGGLFTDLAGPARNLVRLLPDGTRDATFTAGADEAILCLVNEADGDVLFGGQFSASLTRVGQPLATNALTALGSTGVQWLRGESAPEVQSVRFDLSTDNGLTWTPLGAGVRTVGGWALTGQALPANGWLRARARSYQSGYFHGSSSLVETVAPFGATALAAWRALQGLPADGSQDLANPSGDGLPNLLKFAFNLAPAAGDLARSANGGTPVLGTDAQGRTTVSFPRLRASANTGIAYTVETSQDLVLWSPADLRNATSTAVNAQWEIATVVDPVPARIRFARVRVTRVP